MTSEKFEEIFNNRIEKIKHLLIVKAKEYASNDDRLHNFRKAAKRLNTTMEAICWQHFCEKHLVSLDDIIEDTKLGKFPSKDKLEEKLMDIMIYSFLLEATFVEDIEKDLESRVKTGTTYIAMVDPYIEEAKQNISKVYDKDIVEMLKHYKTPLPFIKEILPEGWENSIDIGKLSLEKRKEIYEQYQQEFYSEEKIKDNSTYFVVDIIETNDRLGENFNSITLQLDNTKNLSILDTFKSGYAKLRIESIRAGNIVKCLLVTDAPENFIAREHLFNKNLTLTRDN